jgi:hypothetical protein
MRHCALQDAPRVGEAEGLIRGSGRGCGSVIDIPACRNNGSVAASSGLITGPIAATLNQPAPSWLPDAAGALHDGVSSREQRTATSGQASRTRLGRWGRQGEGASARGILVARAEPGQWGLSPWRQGSPFPRCLQAIRQTEEASPRPQSLHRGQGLPPAGNGSGALPGLRVVGHAGEQPAQFNGGCAHERRHVPSN